MTEFSKMQQRKMKYDYNSLICFFKENNIIVFKDYTNDKINRETRIEGKCIFINCDAFFNKTYRDLLNSNGCCKFHTKENYKRKYKKTCLEKYGVENAFQSKEVKEKSKQTLLDKHGVEYVSQVKEIREKIKNTCLEKYGVEHNSQTEKSKQKYKKTCLEKYGVENAFQSKEVKEKSKQTLLDKHGVEYVSQTENYKQKYKKTCLEKYGVEHVSQNEEIHRKQTTSGFKLKKYILPSGNIIKIQGYEHFAYNDLLRKENIPEEDILNGCGNVPEIWYEDVVGMKHRHFVDIFIPSQNRCIEVKSTWTAEKNKDNIYLKQKAGEELGYRYEIWIYNNKGEKVECHN